VDCRSAAQTRPGKTTRRSGGFRHRSPNSISAVPARYRDVPICGGSSGFFGPEIAPRPFSSHRVLPSSVANWVAKFAERSQNEIEAKGQIFAEGSRLVVAPRYKDYLDRGRSPDAVIEEQLFASGAPSRDAPAARTGLGSTGPRGGAARGQSDCAVGRGTARMRQHHVAGDKVFVDYSGKTYRSPTGSPARSIRRRSPSLCSAPPTTPMRRAADS